MPAGPGRLTNQALPGWGDFFSRGGLACGWWAAVNLYIHILNIPSQLFSHVAMKLGERFRWALAQRYAWWLYQYRTVCTTWCFHAAFCLLEPRATPEDEGHVLLIQLEKVATI